MGGISRCGDPGRGEYLCSWLPGLSLAYFELNKTFSVGIEPGYAQRGAACVPGIIIFHNDATVYLNYLELPLMISAKFPMFNNKFEVLGKAGYGISKVLNGYEEYRDTGFEAPEKYPIDFTNPFGINVYKWDNGIYGGLGFGYNLGANQLFMESTYYIGMKDVDKYATSKNRSIHFGLGYMINL